MRTLLSCFSAGCLSLASLCTSAQAPPPATGAPGSATGRQELAAEPFVVQQWRSVYSYNADGTGFREQTLTVVIQSEAALRAFSVISVPFAGSSEKAQIVYARVRHATDNSAVDTPTADAFEEPAPVTREAPLYSDLKQRELPLKSLRVGDTLEWQSRVERTKAEAPGEFWGHQDWTTGAVSLAESVELRVPASRTITAWTNPESKLSATISVEGAQRVYRWSTSALDPTVGAKAEAAKKARQHAILTSAQQADVTLGKLPDVAWTSFPSWEAVGSWYRSLESDRITPDAAIIAKVNELTAGKATLDEKVRAVYAYVSGQIHYIGVDLGIGRYQPHHAGAVLENQYGDCKDKHTLLAAMLQVLGVQADAALIGAGIRFNRDVPSPDAFNHVITYATVGKDAVWLDSTEEVAPYRMMFATLRDKDSLVIEPAISRVLRSPADPPFPTFEKMTAVGSLDKDGNAESHFTLAQRGDEELFVRSILRQVTPAQYDELTQKIVANLGFGGTVTHAAFLHIDDPAQPLVMEWDYHRDKPGNDWENLRVTPPLMMTLLPVVDEKDSPIADIPLIGAREITSTAQVKLPPGWKAELPEAVHARSAYGNYDLTFRFDQGTVYAERHWTLSKANVPQADWKTYKAWTDKLAAGTDPYVQLRTTATAASGKTSPDAAARANTPDPAEQYIDQAVAALRQNHLEEGQLLLDKARALSPGHAALTGDYGYLAWRRGNHPEALRLYRKELEEHPDTLWVYNDLARLQYETGDTDGAVETLQRFTHAAPNDANAAASLIGTLNGIHKDREALLAANDSLQRLPADAQSNTLFQAALMQAELRGGEKERGAATAATLLGNTTDLQLMNNTAYALASAGANLPLAESTARSVVDKLSAESQTWTLDESLVLLRERSELLAATWDTLGYVLLQEGHPEQAIPYIRARWLYRASAEVGEHLGDAEVALHNTNEARSTYRLALATLPHFNALGVRSTRPLPEEAVLQRRLAALAAPAGTANSPATPEQLQALRIVPLSSSLDTEGTAEYKFLLSKAGIQRVEASGPKDLPGALALLRSASLPATLFPADSTAQLVRVGMLNCHSKHCQLVFMP